MTPTNFWIRSHEYGKDLSVFNYIINTDDLTIEEVYKKTVKILKNKIK